MGAKLLFVVGIIVAHGALAASWVREEAPKQRASVATCIRAPGALPNITPQRELYAMTVIPIVDEEPRQP
ncbi:MAG: hypothetical protein ABI769_03455 [Pseudomonadota bacterium]